MNTTLSAIHARIAQPLAGGKPMMVQPTATTAESAASDSSDEEEEATEHKFGEPLTRTKAQDGFVDRGENGLESFTDRTESDDPGNTVDRVCGDT